MSDEGQSQGPPRRDLICVAALSVLCGALTAGVDLPVARIPAGLLLELVLPGYALTALVTRRRELGAAEIALSALGLSLVVSALGGLLLNELPGKTVRLEWAVFLTLLTLLGVAGALRWPITEAIADQQPRVGAREPLYLRWAEKLESSSRIVINCFLAVLTLVLGVAAVLITSQSVNSTSGFTSLSAIPSSHARRSGLAVMVTSHERHEATFDVTVRENGRLRRFEEIRLRSQQSWQLTTPRLKSNTRRVRVDLRRAGSSASYLHTIYYPRPQTARRHASKTAR